MSLSSFGFILILLLVLSTELSQAQFWGTSTGRCWGRFEQYHECASTCPDTCDDIRWPNPAKICNLMCRNGCDCIRPFVRLNKNPMSPCVHPRQCRFM
ncbi:unnamed protein product [Rotaria sp. Silwood1]|nr:unnamed protein product [Rotaria sp. Silwood1]CAF1243183.1 unnamed protein product [Rotaria sp. Silwood1]CAF1245917.1 unnamed protein product [Rotaria sp. Silwood1]CAF3471786.1 unnamed protein product [Rotaria sp. Silwood1]CAF3498621.1 unnamed protein product [Rotaria sp. Silwood1]